MSYWKHILEAMKGDESWLIGSAYASIEQWFDEHWESLWEQEARPRTVLEIGTLRGVTAAIMAQYADLVITIDVKARPHPFTLWRKLGLMGRICHIVVTDNAAKRNIVNNLQFDMAFIDGSHKQPDVQLDYSIARKCGLLVFHDFDDAHGGVVNVMRSIGAEKWGHNLGIWRNQQAFEANQHATR